MTTDEAKAQLKKDVKDAIENAQGSRLTLDEIAAVVESALREKWFRARVMKG